MDKELLLKVQDRLYEMGVTIAQILEKNNIDYMLSFGTLLGAVRHGDFVPWDDDFDLWIFDDNYAKAIQVLRKELPSNMFLEDEESEPKYFHAWAHVKDIKTIVENILFIQDTEYKHKGLSIDLYRIKKMNSSELEKYIYEEKIKYFNRRVSIGNMSKKEYKAKIAQAKEAFEEEKYNLEKKEVYGYISPYKNKYLLKEEVLPLNQIQFRKHNFACPNNSDAVLKRIYGNYLELPPLEKRIQHYSSVTFL